MLRKAEKDFCRKSCTPTYWTLFWYGSNECIRSKHKSQKAAERAARTCERYGGQIHRIVEVKEVKGYEIRRKG